MNPKIFSSVLIALDVAAAVVNLAAGDLRLAIYWLNIAVLLLLFFTKRI